jgi:hypothetical protein
MVRSLAHAMAVLAVLSTATLAGAQEKGRAAASDKARLGVAVSLTPLDSAAAATGGPVATPVDIYLSVDLGQLRIEPSLGINHYAIDGGDKASAVNLGVGALLMIRRGTTSSIYAGPRIFLDFVSVKDNAGLTDSGTDLTLAGALGGEWFADPRFSLGAEARLGFTVAGQLSDAGTILRPGSTRVSTAGLVFLRFYL